MNLIVKHFCNTYSQHIASALGLTTVLSLSSSIIMSDSAVAAPAPLQLAQPSVLKNQVRSNQLPSVVANAAKADLSRRVGIPAEKLKITNSSQETWPNGCLGIPKPDELCSQALVEGWRITLSDGGKTWIYRSDRQGRVLRLENQSTSAANLSPVVANAVLQDASQRLKKTPISELRIVQVQRRNWSDSCLGLGSSGVSCAAVVVPGALVTVEARQQSLVYRTDDSGSKVLLDEAASSFADAGTIKPVKIPTSELPPPLKPNMIFQAISSGGITGRTYKTTLMNNGRVMRVLVNPKGSNAQPQTQRISQSQLRQFQQLLQQQQFTQFNSLSYPAPKGAADYITVTLTSKDGTSRYTDINQNCLPPSLQKVIQAWNQLISRT